jgi:hypothetical protein
MTSFTVNDECFDYETKRTLYSVFHSIGNVVKSFLPKDITANQDDFYPTSAMFLIENVVNNFLMVNNNINVNHLYITKGFNSIQMGIKANKEYDYVPSDKNMKAFTRNSNLAFYITVAMERTVKIISKNEMDTFRGQYHYLLMTPEHFIGYNFLFIPILLILRTFYQLLYVIYSCEYKRITNTIHVSKIISYLCLIVGVLSLCFLHIEYIENVLELGNDVYALYVICGLFMIVGVALLVMLKLNEHETVFVDNMLRFLLALNCFNFVFVNIGMVLTLTCVVLPLEFSFVIVKQRRKTISCVFMSCGMIYRVLKNQKYLHDVIANFKMFNCNVYVILCISIMLMCFRVCLFGYEIIMDKIQKGKEETKDKVNE